MADVEIYTRYADGDLYWAHRTSPCRAEIERVHHGGPQRVAVIESVSAVELDAILEREGYQFSHREVAQKSGGE